MINVIMRYACSAVEAQNFFREDFIEEVTFEVCLKGWVYNPLVEISWDLPSCIQLAYTFPVDI